MKGKEYAEKYLSEMKGVLDRISRDDIERAVSILFEAWKNDKQVFAMGNGGSASTATHFVCDLAKGTIVPGKKRFRVIGLTDNVPLMSALTNDDGWENLYTEQLENLLNPGDVVVGFSVHGGAGKDKAGAWSQNLLKAMKLAKDRGAKTIGFSGYDGGPMKQIVDACVVVPANSTPHVESLHLALEHLVCNCLKEMIQNG